MLNWMEKRPGLAAWVQSIGSVIAIFSAIGIAYWQNYSQQAAMEKDKIQNQILVVQTAIQFADWFENTAKITEEAIASKRAGKNIGFDPLTELFSDAERPIRSVPLANMGNFETSRIIIDLLDKSQNLRMVRWFAGHPDRYPEIKLESSERHVGELRSESKQQKDALLKILAALQENL